MSLLCFGPKIVASNMLLKLFHSFRSWDWAIHCTCGEHSSIDLTPKLCDSVDWVTFLIEYKLITDVQQKLYKGLNPMVELKLPPGQDIWFIQLYWDVGLIVSTVWALADPAFNPKDQCWNESAWRREQRDYPGMLVWILDYGVLKMQGNRRQGQPTTHVNTACITRMWFPYGRKATKLPLPD
jgi:hypothetical protein